MGKRDYLLLRSGAIEGGDGGVEQRHVYRLAQIPELLRHGGGAWSEQGRELVGRTGDREDRRSFRKAREGGVLKVAAAAAARRRRRGGGILIGGEASEKRKKGGFLFWGLRELGRGESCCQSTRWFGAKCTHLPPSLVQFTHTSLLLLLLVLVLVCANNVQNVLISISKI